MDASRKTPKAGRLGRRAGAGAQPELEEAWQYFLREECQRDDGLLCLYDGEKSEQVSFFCSLLAQHILAYPAEDQVWPPEAARDLMDDKKRGSPGSHCAKGPEL